MFEKLLRHLTSAGYEVYPIGKQKEGECTNPYVVLKEGQPVETLDSTINKQLYEIWLYYPVKYYSRASKERDKLNNIIKEMKGLRRAYEDLPFNVDSQKKAYVTKLTYYMNVLRR